MAPDLSQQIGPLPLGAWLAVVGGGLGIAWYTRSQQGDGNIVDVPVEDVSGTPGVGAGAGWIAVPPPTTAAPGQPAITTNEEWARAAINYLIAQGYDANVADAAIRKYIEAAELGIQEYALVRLALTFLGSPPSPLPPPPPPPVVPPPVVAPPPVVTPPPGVVAPPAPTGIRIHVVTPWNTKGSTLSGIAQIYYGNANRWREIYNANAKGVTRPDGSPGFISNPNYLRVGDRVYVP